MRLLITGILFLVCTYGFSQADDSRINFALLHFDITGDKLDFREHEQYLSAISSLGDKSIILEEIFNTILTRKDYSIEDSLIGYWLGDLTRKDRVKATRLPAVSDDWRENTFKFVRIAQMCRAHADSTALSEAYLKIMKDGPAFFPHIPPEVSAHQYDIVKLVEKYYLYTKWAVEYPIEADYFVRMVRQMAFDAYGSDSDASVVQYMENVVQNAMESKGTDILNVPEKLEYVLALHEADKAKSIRNAALCNEEGIETFLSEAYSLMYDEAIPKEVKQQLLDFIREHQLYDPELIYLALIITYYE